MLCSRFSVAPLPRGEGWGEGAILLNLYIRNKWISEIRYINRNCLQTKQDEQQG